MADGTTVPVDSLRTDLEPEPDATEAPPTPRSVPDLEHVAVDLNRRPARHRERPGGDFGSRLTGT